MRHLLILALLCAFALASATYVPDLLEAARKPPPKPTASKLERSVKNLEGQVAAMELTADRYAKWKTCVSLVPVNELGDPDNRFGYGYDERDGTGPTFMPALAVDREDETPEYAFLRFARRDDCHSQPTQPGGTAEDASVGAPDAIQTVLVASSQERASSSESRVRVLERRVVRLSERAEALERMSERFDEWESCLSWVPVTEYGDADGALRLPLRREGGRGRLQTGHRRGHQRVGRPGLPVPRVRRARPSVHRPRVRRGTRGRR